MHDVVEVGVSAVAVAHQDAVERGPDAARVDRGSGGVTDVHRGQVLGARHMQIHVASGSAGDRHVRVRHRRGGDQLPHPGQERLLQQPRRPSPHRGDEPRGHLRAEQRGENARGPAYRQVVPAHQPGGPRREPRPVLHPAHRPRRHVTNAGGAAAGAGLRYDVVLGHVRARRRGRGAEHLVPTLVEDRGVGQVRAAPAACGGFPSDGFVRVVDQPQCGARRPVLLARPSARAGTRGPLRRGLGERQIRRRWLGGVRGVLAQAPLQLCHPRGQPLTLGAQLLNQA